MKFIITSQKKQIISSKRFMRENYIKIYICYHQLYRHFAQECLSELDVKKRLVGQK